MACESFRPVAALVPFSRGGMGGGGEGRGGWILDNAGLKYKETARERGTIKEKALFIYKPRLRNAARFIRCL